MDVNYEYYKIFLNNYAKMLAFSVRVAYNDTILKFKEVKEMKKKNLKAICSFNIITR